MNQPILTAISTVSKQATQLKGVCDPLTDRMMVSLCTADAQQITPLIDIKCPHSRDCLALSANGTVAFIGEPCFTQSSIELVENGFRGLDGRVHVFREQNGHWIEETLLKNPNTQSGSRFGWACAINGNGTVALISELMSVHTGVFVSHVYHYTVTSKGWTVKNILNAPETMKSLFFGHSVALNEKGNVAVIGGLEKSQWFHGGPGRACVFKLAQNRWELEAVLQPESASMATVSQFGHHVDIMNEQIHVHSLCEHSNNDTIIHCFEKRKKQWVLFDTFQNEPVEWYQPVHS